MGCADSKVSDENQKLRKELTTLRATQRKNTTANNNNNDAAGAGSPGPTPADPLSPPPRNGDKDDPAAVRAGSLASLNGHFTPRKPPAGAQSAGGGPVNPEDRWRRERLGGGFAVSERRQCVDLFAPSGKRTFTFDAAVAAAAEEGACGYAVARRGGRLLPPRAAAAEASSPLTGPALAAAARAVSESHPAVAAYTLASPLGVEASLAMYEASLPSVGHTPYAGAAEAYEKYRQFQTLLNSQLLSIPPFRGVCFKGSTQRAGAVYKPGNVVTWCHPTSSSVLPEVAAASLDEPSDRPSGTLFVVQSLNGRDIAEHSCAAEEREVVFPANTQFRVCGDLSEAVKTLFRRQLTCSLRHVDVVALCEVRLVVWRDVLSALDNVEEATCGRLVEILEMASQAAEMAGRYTRDVVSKAYILGAPMSELPPRATGGATVVHLVADSPELVGVLKMVTFHLSPADINELNADGLSPLHLALAHNNTASALHLLTLGASVSSLGTVADGALAAAITNTWTAGTGQAMVERILDEIAPGAESVATSKTVLRAAAGLGRRAEAVPLLEMLCKKSKVLQPKYLEDTSGMIAAACASPNVDDDFLEYLVNDAQAKDNGAAVEEAVRAGNHHIIKHLKALGVPLEGAVTDGRTAMHTAVSTGNLAGVAALKGAGANLHASDSFGWTLAHEAAYHNHPDILQSLQMWGCKMDNADVDGCTPLWWAADAGNEEVIKLLNGYGARVGHTDSTDTSAVQIAAYNGRTETVRLLHQLGANINNANKQGRTPAWLAAGSGSLPTLELLQSLKADLRKTDKLGMTPAHIAAQEGWLDTLELLFTSDVELNRKDNTGRTPLHYAVSKSRFLCIRYLVRTACVNISVAGDDPAMGGNCMAIHIASSKASFEEHPEEFSLLMSPETVNAVCVSGAPLDIAHGYNRHKLANLLRGRGAESHKPLPPPEVMEKIPDVSLEEVLFRHPLSLPEKNTPGAVIHIVKSDGDKFTYTVNGDQRPTFKVMQLVKGSHGLALKFPDAGTAGRQVYLPSTGIREILGGLVSMASSMGITHNIPDEFAALAAQGHVAPVRKGKSVDTSAIHPPDDGTPCFLSVAYLSDAKPYVCGKIKVLTQYRGGEEGLSKYQWYRCADGVAWSVVRKQACAPDESGKNYTYYVTSDDLGCQLKALCTPVRSDGVEGPKKESEAVTVEWPPHLGVAIVSKLVESTAATRVTVVVGDIMHSGVYLQLNENRLKIKKADTNPNSDSLAAGVVSNVRCILEEDSQCFLLEGLSVAGTVKIRVETRVDRDFLVALIRVWCACCTPEVGPKVLGSDFEAAWTSLPARGEEGTRADAIWKAFQESSGNPPTDPTATPAVKEATTALLTLCQGFASGTIRQPPTRAGRAAASPAAAAAAPPAPASAAPAGGTPSPERMGSTLGLGARAGSVSASGHLAPPPLHPPQSREAIPRNASCSP